MYCEDRRDLGSSKCLLDKPLGKQDPAASGRKRAPYGARQGRATGLVGTEHRSPQTISGPGAHAGASREMIMRALHRAVTVFLKNTSWTVSRLLSAVLWLRRGEVRGKLILYMRVNVDYNISSPLSCRGLLGRICRPSWTWRMYIKDVPALSHTHRRRYDRESIVRDGVCARGHQPGTL